MLIKFHHPHAVNKVIDYIEADSHLEPHVLDVQAKDDLLVVLIDGEVSTTFVEPLLKRVWSGPIEIYGPSDMVSGT